MIPVKQERSDQKTPPRRKKCGRKKFPWVKKSPVGKMRVGCEN